jgi:hypothetical protein
MALNPQREMHHTGSLLTTSINAFDNKCPAFPERAEPTKYISARTAHTHPVVHLEAVDLGQAVHSIHNNGPDGVWRPAVPPQRLGYANRLQEIATSNRHVRTKKNEQVARVRGQINGQKASIHVQAIMLCCSGYSAKRNERQACVPKTM